MLGDTPPNIDDDVVVADVDLGQLAENRKTGAATTFVDRRRRADPYRVWPSHTTTD
ncbi:MAG TPA: hypothetical protein VFE65_03435 [Pseudonocardia sp.]|nr:hypothetical protein [Pseudonocardia sp.]